MSILEYANDVGKTVNEILELCKKLGIKKDNDEDILEDDDIIILDNEIQNDNNETSEELDIVTNQEKKEIHKNKTKSKPNNKGNTLKSLNKRKEDFRKNRKEMYKHKEKLQSNVNADKNIVIYKENMTVSDLAGEIKVSPAEIIKKVMMLGQMLNINAVVEYELAELITDEYQKKIVKDSGNNETNFEDLEIVDKEEDLIARPPVVTIMGHVDHGKTTLLDTIRQSDVAAYEAGGITQAISAYQITYNDKKITFIDTPGHAAFTQMRARGASITDIIIIIVAADDGVMPQTVEVIDHAKAAGVPIIVAINKIDKPSADADKVMSEMSGYGLMPEAWGGDVMYVNISALNKLGIDDLLDRILLVSEMSELKANPNRYASGTVIESQIDKSKGVISTLLIQNGTLRIGDPIVVGNYYGKVRTLKNDKGENLTKAYPSMPVTVTGISQSPSAGDKFMAFEEDKKAKTIAEQRSMAAKNKNRNSGGSLTLDDLFNRISAGEKEVNIIIKADVKGSEEAIKNSLLKLDVDGIRVNIIRSSIGVVSESDIVLAQASNAIILGFNIRPNNKILEYAKEKEVEIRLYNIIYKLIEDIEDALKGKLEPVYKEEILGEAEVRKLFKYSKVGTIAGCLVTRGIIKRASKARLIRDGVIIYDGIIGSVAREKDQVKEVGHGLECGITIENFNDIKENDVIETYDMVEVKR